MLIKYRSEFFLLILLIGFVKFSKCQRETNNNNNVVRLRQFNVDYDWITLSGFSSGGTFAQQMQISYSKLFRGIAVFSHTYYRCGLPNGRIDDYDSVCTRIGLNRSQPIPPYDVNKAIEDIQSYSNRKLIEDPNNLRDTLLYVYSGTRNSLFTLDQSLKILDIYGRYLKSPSQIYTRVQSAELVLPTKNFGGPCSEEAGRNFFLANCGFSGAFEALNFLHGNILRKPRWNLRIQRLASFDQTEFFNGVNGRIDMDQLGYLYIPTGCRFPNSYCLLHFYFHGCLNGREFNGTNHIINSGYLEVAEENHIVMVFPQAIMSPENEIGCWDTFGVTGELYATKNGSQVSVIRNMLRRIVPALHDNAVSLRTSGQISPSPALKILENTNTNRIYGADQGDLSKSTESSSATSAAVGGGGGRGGGSSFSNSNSNKRRPSSSNSNSITFSALNARPRAEALVSADSVGGGYSASTPDSSSRSVEEIRGSSSNNNNNNWTRKRYGSVEERFRPSQNLDGNGNYNSRRNLRNSDPIKFLDIQNSQLIHSFSWPTSRPSYGYS